MPLPLPWVNDPRNPLEYSWGGEEKRVGGPIGKKKVLFPEADSSSLSRFRVSIFSFFFFLSHSAPSVKEWIFSHHLEINDIALRDGVSSNRLLLLLPKSALICQWFPVRGGGFSFILLLSGAQKTISEIDITRVFFLRWIDVRFFKYTRKNCFFKSHGLGKVYWLRIGKVCHFCVWESVSYFRQKCFHLFQM